MSEQGLQMLHGREVYVTGHGQALDNIHDESRCAGEPCVIHAPIQGQAWSDWPTLWRSDWGGFMERVCEHGVGHPAVEDVLRGNDGSGGHGCCGCPCFMPDHMTADFKRDEDDMGNQAEPDAESLAAEVAQADMQSKIYALREQLSVLTQAARLGYDAGFPADSPFQAFLAGQIAQTIEEAGVKAVTGVVTRLFWELSDRG